MKKISFFKIVFSSLLLLFSTFQIQAQQPNLKFTLKAKIVDASTQKPLEFATVALKKMRDSSLVSGTITNEQGEFKLEDIPPGGYSYEIAFIGYEKVTGRVFFKPQSSAPINDLGTVKMAPSATTLEGAEITADKSFVMNNIDRKTYNTEQLSVTSGGNVTDILQNIPSVDIDQDGVVSLRGNENVTILIDGRPSGMTGSGGKSLLESIPSSAIEKVEVITNPSAKYDPDGISGIINIITKKNKLQGITGNVGVNTSFGNRYGANASLSYRKGKWNIYSNYGFTKDVRNSTGSSYREASFGTITSIVTQDESGQDNRIGNNVKLGADFNINDHNTLSASAFYNKGNSDSRDKINYYLTDNFSFSDSSYKRNTIGNGDNQNMDFNLELKHYFKHEGRTIDFQGTASLEDRNSGNKYDQLGYINDFTPVPFPPELERDNTIEQNGIYTASADYEHAIGKDKKLEAGYKGTFRKFDSDYNYESFDQTSAVFMNDSNRSNRFIYSDQLHAIYAQYRQSIKKFGYQIGVRSEYATTQSELVTTNEIYNKDYFSVYPSAFVTYKPGDKSQYKATYSRRINRPNRRQLNPFTDYEDPLNLRKGNPYLNPEYTDSYELEYNKIFGKLVFTGTGYYRITHDNIQRYRDITPGGITVTTYKNLAQSQTYGLELIFNGNPYKWWSFTISGNFFENKLDASNLEAGLNSSSLSASGRAFTTFKLPYKTELQLSYFYRAPMTVTQGKMKDMQMMTIAASKKVLKDKGVISVRLSDPFNTQRFGFQFTGDNYYQDFTRKRESRILNIAFTYRFGELKDRDARQRPDQGPKEDMDNGF